MATARDYLKLLITHRHLWFFIFLPLLLLPIPLCISGDITNDNDPNQPLDSQKVAEFGQRFFNI
jgi:hypothetical protein